MATYPTCSECGEVLEELGERESGMCEKCQKELGGEWKPLLGETEK